MQRFMRVLTHPQHAGKPLTPKRAKAPKPARKAAKPVAKPSAGPEMKVAGKPAAPGAAAAVRPASNASSATAVADKPRMPDAPTRPVEVFSPDRPTGRDKPAAQDPLPGDGPLLDGLDDSSMGLMMEPQPSTDDAPPKGDTDLRSIEKAHEPAAPAGPQIGDVVELIEKLRTHVDAQGGRFEQAMGVLDNIRASAAALPEIRERIDTMLASIDELKANQFRGHEKVERALSAQSSRLDEIAQAIARATQRDEKLAQSLTEINQTILAVSGTNDRLASAIDAMRRHEAERDARIGRALTGAQRWLIVLTLVMAVGMIATIIAAVFAGR